LVIVELYFKFVHVFFTCLFGVYFALKTNSDFVPVIVRNYSYTFGGYVLLGERYDKISGLYPSCGLIAEPLLSEPLWALLLDAPYMSASSPTLNHFTSSVSRSIDKSVRLRKFLELAVIVPSASQRLGLSLTPPPAHLQIHFVQGLTRICGLAIGHIPGPWLARPGPLLLLPGLSTWSGFESPGLDRPGRLPHQQGLCQARLGYRSDVPAECTANQMCLLGYLFCTENVCVCVCVCVCIPLENFACFLACFVWPASCSLLHNPVSVDSWNRLQDFGLWRVCFPPILIRTDRRLLV